LAKDRTLPQLDGRNVTCGAGFETWLQYVDGFELRHFCAFELINDKRGLTCMTDYHRKLVEAAVENGFGVINEGLTTARAGTGESLSAFLVRALKKSTFAGLSSTRISPGNTKAMRRL